MRSTGSVPLIAYRRTKDDIRDIQEPIKANIAPTYVRQSIPLRKTFLVKGRSLMVLAVRNREPTSIGRQSNVCNRDILCFDRRSLMTKALAFIRIP
jgi:hypothetical protein